MIDRHGVDYDRVWIPINGWNINVNEIANSCFIGPQGEILEKVRSFNDMWRTYMPFNPKTNTNEDPIGITKKFYWKRGSYNNIKKIYSEGINRFREKPRGMNSLRERISNNSYSARNFWDTLIDIDDKIQRLRWQNFRWVDNTNVVRTYIDNLKHQITESIEINAVNYPNIEIEIYVDATDGANATKIVVLMHIKDISVNVKHGGEVIGKVPTRNITLHETISCWAHINDHCMSENPFDHPRPSHSGIRSRGHFFDTYGLKHPFVSSNSNYYGSGINRFWTNICKGDHSSPWDTALWNLNLDVMAHYANIWANNYEIPSTNPLNRINKCFFGLPEEIGANVVIIPGGTDMGGDEILRVHADTCSFPSRYLNHLSTLVTRNGWSGEGTSLIQDYIALLDNYCDKCQLKERCTKSLDLSLYPFQKEGIIEMHWDDSEYHSNLSDIPFIRQQLMMHITAQFLIRQSHFQPELHNVKEYCLSFIDDVLEKAVEDAKILSSEYNLDYWYTTAEYENRNTESDVLLERWDAIMNNTIGTWEELRDEYCNLIYGVDYNDMVDPDDRDDFHEYTEGMRELDLFNAITATRIRMDNENNTTQETVIPEEELSVEDRAIRWAAQRGGAINFGQPNN